MKNINFFIKQSGYKVEFLAQKLDMPRMTFYHKRKNAGFTVEEMEKLFDIINVEHIEDKAFFELMQTSKRESTLIARDKEKNLYN
ncbi:hypothetical protein [Olivibacter sitiensis]|uniref:hypothetical protein n=1 Tax=Olivibacter sitiensis TaxID=376470 RepID=UPI0012FC6C3C|nr:hypothetical protein [Olivibacter sitiensis]